MTVRPVADRPTPEPTIAGDHAVLRTVSELLAVVEGLPAPDRAAARARIGAALEGDARRCRAALGLLALDLAPATDPARRPAGATPDASTDDLTVRVHLVDLPATAVRRSLHATV